MEPIHVGGFSFSKTTAIAKCKDIMKSFVKAHTVTEKDVSWVDAPRLEQNSRLYIGQNWEADLLYEVISKYHPNGAQKLAMSVEYFYVKVKAGNVRFTKKNGSIGYTNATCCFHIHYQNTPKESDDDVGIFSRCTKGEMTHFGMVSEAMRVAVIPQIIRFKSAFWDAVSIDVVRAECPVSKVPITSANCHVDHFDTPFWKLRDQFIASQNMQESDVQVQKGPDSKMVLTDVEFKQRWENYHAEHAKLRVIAADANMKAYHDGPCEERRPANKRKKTNAKKPAKKVAATGAKPKK